VVVTTDPARPATIGVDLAALERVLVVKLSSLGDIVHVTPCLRALRRSCPRARITMVVERRFAALVENDPSLDERIAIDHAPRAVWRQLADAARALRARRAPRFDLAIDFQGLLRSAAWVYASAARIKVGRGGRRPGWDAVVAPCAGRHAVEICADVAAALGVRVDDLEPRLFVDQAADRRLAAQLAALGLPGSGFLLVNPFSRWASKTWPVERWAELVRRARREVGLPILLTGGPGEEADAARLVAAIGPPAPASFVGNLALDEALCLYRRGTLMVTGDTGPMHAAAALGTRVVALFGPTLPESTGPCGAGHVVVQAARPTHAHAYREDAYGRLIGAIDVDMVMAGIRRALGGGEATREARTGLPASGD